MQPAYKHVAIPIPSLPVGYAQVRLINIGSAARAPLLHNKT
jgi:hypothetical protein